MRSWQCFVAILAVLPGTSVPGDPEAAGYEVVTERFRVSLDSRLQPIRINTLHEWAIFLTNHAGQPVSGAEFIVGGGMPEHDHGLPTAPRVRSESGDGHYLLEGVKFHMSGEWELILEIEFAGATDTGRLGFLVPDG